MNRIATLAAALIATAASFGAQAQTAGSYDYAAKFYPHPAWLYLASEAPREMGQHPAVIVARRAAAGTEAMAQAYDHAYPHPAWGYAAAESARTMGEHPAVLVARRAAAGTESVAQAYDHAYPHPAWGYAAAESAHEMGQHPAVIVAGRATEATRPVLVAQAR